MLPALPRLATRHRRPLMGGALLVGLAGVASILHLAATLDTDSLSLMPRGLPALDALRESMRIFGSSDRVYVRARPLGDASGDEAVGFLEEVAAHLPVTHVTESSARIDLGLLYHRALLPRLALLLDEGGLDALARAVEPEALEAALRMTRRRLAMTMSARERRLITIDPLELGRLLGDMPEAREAGVSLDPQTGGLLMADGSFLLVASPTRGTTDIPFDLELRDLVAAAVDEAAEGDPSRLEVAWGGAFQIALWDFEAMTADMRVNLVTSLVAVAAIFAIGFRSLRSLGVALAPLCLGILATFVVAATSGWRLTSATLGFGAMLVGLGIDFSIVLLGRWGQARSRGSSPEDALGTTYGGTMRGVAAGAVTTAAAFLALLASSFPGLAQLGMLTAIGTLACLAAVALLLPALVAVLRPAPRPVFGFGFPSLATTALRAPRATLATAMAFTVLCGVGLTRLHLEDDLRKLRAPDNPGVAFEEDLARRLGRASESVMVLVRGATEGDLEAALSRADVALRALEDEGLVRSTHGPRDLVPDPAVQRKRLARLDALRRSGRLDPTTVGASFDAAATAAGFAPGAMSSFRDALVAALSRERPATLAELAAQRELSLLAPLGAADGAGLAAQIVVTPAPDRSPAALRERFEAQLPPGPGSITITGFVFAAKEIRSQIRRDALVIVPLGTVLVMALIWADMRSVRKALLATVPIGLGLFWMLGLMGLAGISFNFFNIFVLALVQGIGVDYGIHILHRIEEAGLHPAHLGDVSAAVAMAALTTVAGFGSLALCHYPALRSMGLVTTLGTLGSLVAALTVLPALCALMEPPSSSPQES